MTRFYNMYLVSAFTDKPFKGNSTGVIIDKGDLTEEEKLNIAKDINQSVTVFIRRMDTGVYETRFYTPHGEIKLCGHATMATFYAIAKNEYILPIEEGINKIMQFTALGKVSVELEYENYQIKNIYMNLKMKNEEKVDNLDKVLSILGLKKEDIGLPYVDCMPKKISTGLCDIIIPVKNEDILKNVQVDFKEAKKLSEIEDIISYHVFTTKDGINIHQRTFSPVIGVNEETGSGTSTAATMYYLHNNSYTKSNVIYSTQGTYVDRVSKVIAQYKEKDGIVRVGGRAYTFMNGVLEI
ncbi:phenazine biosynthesis protein PhzF [Peptoniphilus lacrimalis DNF00528]|nr:phenazine biosynthesis protein PhzF [Peptoniphilus lacrimalis DNF00528]